MVKEEPFSHEGREYFDLQTGELKTAKVIPSKMRLYHIAMAMKHTITPNHELRKIYEKELCGRISNLTDRISQIRKFEKEWFIKAVTGNIESITQSACESGFSIFEARQLRKGNLVDNHYLMTSKEKDPYLKKLNADLFFYHFSNALYFFSGNRKLPEIITDLKLTTQLQTDESILKTLEQRCNSTLKRFAQKNEWCNLDKEDMYQEGIITMWKASQNYQARNLSKFQTMLRVCLDNKAKNLFLYSQATRRRINRFTIPIGSIISEDESLTGAILDRETAKAWELHEMERKSYAERLANAPSGNRYNEALRLSEQLSLPNGYIRQQDINQDLSNLTPEMLKKAKIKMGNLDHTQVDVYGTIGLDSTNYRFDTMDFDFDKELDLRLSRTIDERQFKIR